jgi:hypothetical protein
MEHMYCRKFCVAILVKWKILEIIWANGSDGIDEGYLVNGLLGTMINDILG